MGGSGSRRRISDNDIDKLESIAKRMLKSAGESQTRNVFISFAYEDINEVNLLRGQAKNDLTDLEFNDRSLYRPFNSKEADYIKRGIRERIKQASVTLVFLSDKTLKSEWVDWEIRESMRQKKGVIAVYSGTTPPKGLPLAVKEFDIVVIPWKHEEIMNAINQAAGER